MLDQVKDTNHLLAFFLFKCLSILLIIDADAALKVADLFLIRDLSGFIDLLAAKNVQP